MTASLATKSASHAGEIEQHVEGAGARLMLEDCLGIDLLEVRLDHVDLDAGQLLPLRTGVLLVEKRLQPRLGNHGDLAAAELLGRLDRLRGGTLLGVGHSDRGQRAHAHREQCVPQHHVPLPRSGQGEIAPGPLRNSSRPGARQHEIALRRRRQNSRIAAIHQVREHTSRAAGERPAEMPVAGIDPKIVDPGPSDDRRPGRRHRPQSGPEPRGLTVEMARQVPGRSARRWRRWPRTGRRPAWCRSR